MNAETVANRIRTIRSRLADRGFTKTNPMQAAELDLERKVLENEGKAHGERAYSALWF